MKIAFLIISCLVIFTKIHAQTQVTSFDHLGEDLGSNPSGFKIFHDQLIFKADNSSYGSELWISSGDSNAATLLKDIFPGNQSGISHTFNDAAVIK